MDDNKFTPPVKEALYLIRHKDGKGPHYLVSGHTAIEAHNESLASYPFSDAVVIQIADITAPKCDLKKWGYTQTNDGKKIMIELFLKES